MLLKLWISQLWQYWIFKLSLAFHCLQLKFLRDVSLDDRVTTESVEKVFCWWKWHSFMGLAGVMTGFTAHLLPCEDCSTQWRKHVWRKWKQFVVLFTWSSQLGMFSHDRPKLDGCCVKRTQHSWAKEACDLWITFETPLLSSSHFCSLLFLPFCTVSNTDHFSLCSVPVAFLLISSCWVTRLAFAYHQIIVLTGVFLTTVHFSTIFSEVLFLMGSFKKRASL